MSTPFTVEPELLHQGARQLDQAAATAEQASRKAREALGSSEAFGPSGEARSVVDAWRRLVEARALEMGELSEESAVLASKVREAADSYQGSDEEADGAIGELGKDMDGRLSQDD